MYYIPIFPNSVLFHMIFHKVSNKKGVIELEFNNPLTEAIIKNNHQIGKFRDAAIQSDSEKSLPDILTQQNLASEFCKKLYKEVNEFNLNLDIENEVAVRLVSFGETIQFGIESIGFSNPSLIIFSGHTSDGSHVQLVQHVNQISMLLLAAKRPEPEKPKSPIGFRQAP